MSAQEEPFWKTKTLEEMTEEEWESLCSGCGQCCLNKIIDEDTGELLNTLIMCQYFDNDSCRCTCYEDRTELVPNCVKLTPARAREFNFLSPTCAYRIIREGNDLPKWHHLVSGISESVHKAGISVQGKGIYEQYVHPDEWCNFVIDDSLTE